MASTNSDFLHAVARVSVGREALLFQIRIRFCLHIAVLQNIKVTGIRLIYLRLCIIIRYGAVRTYSEMLAAESPHNAILGFGVRIPPTFFRL